MPTSLVPLIGPLSFVVQVVWPLIITIGVASEPKGSSPQTLIQWTLYWMFYALWTILESTVLWWFVEYLPLYMEMKAVVFFWLASPTFQGAGYLYYRVISEYAVVYLNQVRDWYELRAPPLVQRHLPATQTKVAPWERESAKDTPSTSN